MLNAIHKLAVKGELKRRQKELGICGYFIFVNDREEVVIDTHYKHPTLVLMEAKDQLDEIRRMNQKLSIENANLKMQLLLND